MRRAIPIAVSIGVITVLGAAAWLVVAKPWKVGAESAPAASPSITRTEVRGVIASCLGVDVTPPFVDPRTGEPITATRVITLAVSMRGYPSGTEVTVPLMLAGQPDSLIELRGVLGPDGRLRPPTRSTGRAPTTGSSSTGPSSSIPIRPRDRAPGRTGILETSSRARV